MRAKYLEADSPSNSVNVVIIVRISICYYKCFEGVGRYGMAGRGRCL